MVDDGEALAAIVIPADLPERLQSTVNLGGGAKPAIDVLYNGGNPIKTRYVESLIEKRVAEANRRISRRADEGLGPVPGHPASTAARSRCSAATSACSASSAPSRSSTPRSVSCRPDSPRRAELRDVSRFAQLAIDNLDLSDQVLAAVAEPLGTNRELLDGRDTPLETFAVGVAAIVSLMLVTMLLASGLLALERQDHTLRRLVRGLVRPAALLTEKALVAGACGTVVALLLLAVVGIFVPLAWSRFALWVLALAPVRSRSARSGPRSACSRARCRPPRCSRSCCRCRSRSSPSCPRGRCRRPSTTSSPRSRRRSLQARARRARHGAGRRRHGRVAAAPGAARRDLRADRARRTAPRGMRARAATMDLRCDGRGQSRNGPNITRLMAFPATRLRRLRAPRRCATSCARRACRRATSSCRCSSRHGPATAARRSTSMPGVDRLCIAAAVEEAGAVAALGIPAVLLFGIPAAKDAEGIGRLRRRGHRPARDARDQGRAPRAARRSPTSACASTPTTATAGSSRDDGTVDNDASARAARAHRGLARRAPAPTSSRRAT